MLFLKCHLTSLTLDFFPFGSKTVTQMERNEISPAYFCFCGKGVYSGVISEGFFLSYVCWVGGLNLDFWDVLCSLVPKSFLSFLIYKQKPWSLSRDEESFGYMYTFSHTHTHTLKFLEKNLQVFSFLACTGRTESQNSHFLTL